MRLTSPALAARYAAGLRDEGTDVVDVGQVGTEQLYFAVGSRDLDGGLMCTASHNPKAYTGAKLVSRGRWRCRGMPDWARCATAFSTAWATRPGVARSRRSRSTRSSSRRR